MKEIVIINGHPNKKSFNYALASAYTKGALSSDAHITHINISELKFNPNLEHGYQQRTPLEPDLEIAIEKIQKAQHIVWVYPTWWTGFPAIMKGFIDRTFLPGIFISTHPRKTIP